MLLSHDAVDDAFDSMMMERGEATLTIVSCLGAGTQATIEMCDLVDSGTDGEHAHAATWRKTL